MNENQRKEGFSIQEIENFTKNHRVEVFLCAALGLAGFFSFFMWGTGWAVIAAAVGAICSVLLPEKTGSFCKKIWQFILKQEQTTQIVLAAVTCILAIVTPPLIFLLLGLHGGKEMRQSLNLSQK